MLPFPGLYIHEKNCQPQIDGQMISRSEVKFRPTPTTTTAVTTLPETECSGPAFAGSRSVLEDLSLSLGSRKAIDSYCLNLLVVHIVSRS